MKKKIIAMIVIMAVLGTVMFMAGCNQVSSNNSNTTDPTSEDNKVTKPTTMDPVVDAMMPVSLEGKGGYVLTTNGSVFTLMVDSDYKYSYYESVDGTRTIEFYAGPTEMIVVDTLNGARKYYAETFEDIDQIYDNPIGHVYAGIQGLEFEQVLGNEKQFVAHQTRQVEQQELVEYTCYDITMTWTDNKEYKYQYFAFVNGDVLVSAYAPDEINPYFTKDCKWKFDVENLVVYNEETKESVNFVVTGITTGESAALNDESEKTYITQTTNIYLELDETNNLKSIKHETDKVTVGYEFIREFEITKPQYDEGWTKMTTDEVKNVLMLLYMLESLV